MLHLPLDAYQAMIGHAYDGLPLEACGLLGGDLATGVADRFYPTGNEAASSKLYTIPAKQLLRADREAEDRGGEIIGVMHSHTHTESWPSPTDIQTALEPSWHYIIVSLKRPEPVLRSFRIVDGEISEDVVAIGPPVES